jgi:hypothetical protein
MCLHGVLKKIVSNQGTQFTSRFCEKLHEAMDAKLNFISVYHPQTDGQTERVNQILEDMLWACALKDGKSCDKSLPYAEFPYNNNSKKVWRCHHLKYFMDESAELLYFEMNQEKIKFLDQKFFEKQKGKFKSLERTWSHHNEDRNLCGS